MNPLEIAKEIFGIALNAGVKKDVVDLLEKKVGLLTEEIATLKTENANLKAKLYDLEQELDRLRPKTGAIDEMQIKFLQLLFKHDELPIEAIAHQLGISEGVANYHRDVLLKLDFIERVNFGMNSDWMEIDQPPTFGISTKGRAHLVENELVL